MKELNKAEVEQVSGAGIIADTVSNVGKEVGQWLGNYLESLPGMNIIGGILDKLFGGN